MLNAQASIAVALEQTGKLSSLVGEDVFLGQSKRCARGTCWQARGKWFVDILIICTTVYVVHV